MTTGRINQVAAVGRNAGVKNPPGAGRIVSPRPEPGEERILPTSRRRMSTAPRARPVQYARKQATPEMSSFLESSLNSSPSTHQRIGGNRRQGGPKRTHQMPGASRRNGCRASQPRPQRHAPNEGNSSRGPGRSGRRLSVTLAHRVSAQAPHRPPPQAEALGRRIARRVFTRPAIVERPRGASNQRPQQLPASTRHASLSLISYWDRDHGKVRREAAIRPRSLARSQEHGEIRPVGRRRSQFRAAFSDCLDFGSKPNRPTVFAMETSASSASLSSCPFRRPNVWL